jgi:hypothetical protein
MLRFARMTVKRNDPCFADAVAVNFAQVFDRFLYAVAGEADVVDRSQALGMRATTASGNGALDPVSNSTVSKLG